MTPPKGPTMASDLHGERVRLVKRAEQSAEKAYRSGIRRALAEVTILRVEAQGRITDKPAKANADRRAQVRAYQVAARRLNALMLEPLTHLKSNGGE